MSINQRESRGIQKRNKTNQETNPWSGTALVLYRVPTAHEISGRSLNFDKSIPDRESSHFLQGSIKNNN